MASSPLYNKTRWRLYASLFIGYSTYYLARTSYVFAKPALMRELNFTKNHLGVMSSGFAACYGASKFVGGLLSDRVSPRAQFSLGLFLTGVLNIALGFTTSVWVFTLLWSANGLFQGLGWPPCTKLLRVWFLPSMVSSFFYFLNILNITTVSGSYYNMACLHYFTASCHFENKPS